MIREPIASVNGPGRTFPTVSFSIEGRDDRGEPVGVGLHPAGPVDDQHRRGPLGGHQAGVLAHQRRGALRARAQLLDGVDRLGPAHLRALTHEAGPHP